EVASIREALEGGTLRPIDAKKRLAAEVVSVFHGPQAAADARDYFESTFQRRETPSEMPEHVLGARTPLVDVLVEAGHVASKGKARRLAQQVGLQVNGERVEDASVEVGPGDEVRVGRHRFLRLVAAE